MRTKTQLVPLAFGTIVVVCAHWKGGLVPAYEKYRPSFHYWPINHYRENECYQEQGSLP